MAEHIISASEGELEMRYRASAGMTRAQWGDFMLRLRTEHWEGACFREYAVQARVRRRARANRTYRTQSSMHVDESITC